MAAVTDHGVALSSPVRDTLAIPQSQRQASKFQVLTIEKCDELHNGKHSCVKIPRNDVSVQSVATRRNVASRVLISHQDQLRIWRLAPVEIWSTAVHQIRTTPSHAYGEARKDGIRVQTFLLINPDTNKHPTRGVTVGREGGAELSEDWCKVATAPWGQGTRLGSYLPHRSMYKQAYFLLLNKRIVPFIHIH
ncbi:hypothetical protein J6590_012908 [Homalodisca vitripennis]|nr:hypothetical protein J6590_012908 [Homalodisca vitripennis]